MIHKTAHTIVHRSLKLIKGNYRSSHWRCSVKKVACNFIKKETLAQVLSCEFCEISKNKFCNFTKKEALAQVYGGPLLPTSIWITDVISNHIYIVILHWNLKVKSNKLKLIFTITFALLFIYCVNLRKSC